MAEQVEIIVGTYEEFLLGYKMELKDGKPALVPTFATKSHAASVRCIAISGKYVISGGADDRIYVYDMQTRKQTQILMHHEGTVNALAFTPDASHILTGGDDGLMTALRVNSWKIEGQWKKAHDGAAVTNISCHPSGKLALSLGGDSVLCTWNLIKGRVAFKTNLKNKSSLGKAPDCVSWSPDGDFFTLTGQNVIEILCIQNADIVKSEKCQAKPVCVCWVAELYVMVGLENGNIMLVCINEGENTTIFKAHEGRIKGMNFTNGVLSTVSSSGDLALWNLNIQEKSLEKIVSTNIGCRPTCIAMLDLSQFGEEYVIKKEMGNQTDRLVNESKKQNENNKTQQLGTVIVEYEEDEKTTVISPPDKNSAPNPSQNKRKRLNKQKVEEIAKVQINKKKTKNSKRKK